ncbi:MAG: GNAT family N-acetyltransferase [Chitinophagaceae bacterium]
MQLIDKTSYVLRRASSGDKKLLFDWVNEEEVRNNSINTKSISFEEHESWFNKKLNCPDCGIYIFEIKAVPAGVIRFDFNEIDNAWEIGYSIAKNFRGNGLGKVIIVEGMKLLNHLPVIGYVKEENKKSQAIFNSLGFINNGIHYIKNCPLLKYIKSSAL